MTVTIFLLSLMGAMAIGVPVAFSLIVCGIALMWHLGIYDSQIVAQKILDGADSFVLLAIPFFILAGELMNAGGLSKRIVIATTGCHGAVNTNTFLSMCGACG